VEKAAIVAGSFAPGAVTSTIALRHGPYRNQLYSWRRELRAAAVAEAGIALPDFVPIVAERRADTGAVAIEIAVGDAAVRAAPGVDLAFPGEIIGLLKATA
jgi:transposase-like protein